MYAIISNLGSKTKIVLIIILIFLIIFIFYLIANSLNKSPRLILSTTPESAQITIDGVAVGSSPINTEFEAGKHKIEISKEYYQTEISEIVLRNETIRKNYMLRKNYILPYVGTEYSIDCTAMDSGNICSVNVYEKPFEKYNKEAKEYIKNSIINKTNLETIFFDMTISSGGRAG